MKLVLQIDRFRFEVILRCEKSVSKREKDVLFASFFHNIRAISIVVIHDGKHSLLNRFRRAHRRHKEEEAMRDTYPITMRTLIVRFSAGSRTLKPKLRNVTSSFNRWFLLCTIRTSAIFKMLLMHLLLFFQFAGA